MSGSPSPRHVSAGSVNPQHLLQQHLLSPLHNLAVHILLSLSWFLEHKKILSSAHHLFCQQPYSSDISPMAVLCCLSAATGWAFCCKKDGQWQQAEIVLQGAASLMLVSAFYTSFDNWCKNWPNTETVFSFLLAWFSFQSLEHWDVQNCLLRAPGGFSYSGKEHLKSHVLSSDSSSSYANALCFYRILSERRITAVEELGFGLWWPGTLSQSWPENCWVAAVTELQMAWCGRLVLLLCVRKFYRDSWYFQWLKETLDNAHYIKCENWLMK